MDQRIDRIDVGLQQLFPAFTANRKVNNLKTLTEKYHQYKMDYVRHLSLTPEEENLSKLAFDTDVEKREVHNARILNDTVQFHRSILASVFPALTV